MWIGSRRTKTYAVDNAQGVQTSTLVVPMITSLGNSAFSNRYAVGTRVIRDTPVCPSGGDHDRLPSGSDSAGGPVERARKRSVQVAFRIAF